MTCRPHPRRKSPARLCRSVCLLLHIQRASASLSSESPPLVAPSTVGFLPPGACSTEGPTKKLAVGEEGAGTATFSASLAPKGSRPPPAQSLTAAFVTMSAVGSWIHRPHSGWRGWQPPQELDKGREKETKTERGFQGSEERETPQRDPLLSLTSFPGFQSSGDGEMGGESRRIRPRSSCPACW